MRIVLLGDSNAHFGNQAVENVIGMHNVPWRNENG